MNNNRTSLLVLLFITLSAIFFLSGVDAGNRTVLIGPGFWNIRAPFANVGTQMSLAQLANGKFVIVDTVDVDDELKGEIDDLTKNGTLMVAVVATHPFHTTYFPSFYALYPKVPYYGTPRHLKMFPNIPWAGSTYECNIRQMWLPEIHMRIPRGANFVTDGSHFSGIHLFHTASKTFHIDDTLIIHQPSNDMTFESTLKGSGLFHVGAAPYAFRDWVQKYINEWDFENIVAAHNGVKLKVAKDAVKTLLNSTLAELDTLTDTYTKMPSPADETLFQAMQVHENACVE